MKILTYKIQDENTHQIGVLQDAVIYNLNSFFGNISLIELFQVDGYQDRITKHICDVDCIKHDIQEITILSPIPKPTSFRDAYAFRQHVSTSRKNRGAEMIAEFDQFPVFYFSNHNAIFADREDIALMPDYFEKLDYELEFAIVIGKGGKNILSKEADKHIAGFCILNDISGRTLQMEEMKLNLGPAKGKDFASSFGPYMVTPDELDRALDLNGKFHLRMTCHVNDKLISDGNTNDLYHPFTKMIERASMNTNLLPGDILGSGTVGTGCILELRPENVGGWLKKGDVVRLEVEGLGVLENKII